jgi:hypothetical protein
MGDRLHLGTLLWGLVLAAWGVGLLGVGVGWWDLELVDLRYAGPILIIVVGAVILFGAMLPNRGSSRNQGG